MAIARAALDEGLIVRMGEKVVEVALYLVGMLGANVTGELIYLWGSGRVKEIGKIRVGWVVRKR